MRAVAADSLLMLTFLMPRTAESAQSPPVVSTPGPDQIETIVFVGRLISIQEIQLAPCKPSADGLCTIEAGFDTGYEARYRVLQRVSGSLDDEEVRLSIYSHRGFPAMALHANALLFVARHGGKDVLHRYQGYAVHATTEGGWAHCGNLDTRLDGGAPSPSLRPQSFAKDFGPAAQLVDDPEHEKYPLDAFKVENDRIVCPRGIDLPDLYELVRNGVMKSRGVDLPPLAEVALTR